VKKIMYLVKDCSTLHELCGCINVKGEPIIEELCLDSVPRPWEQRAHLDFNCIHRYIEELG